MGEAREKTESRAWKGKGRILLMDDEDCVLEVGGELLDYLGYEAAYARDGEEALHLYQMSIREKRPFAAVIVDLTVPGGMGGQEAVRRLREIDPGVKAIVSSGYADDPVMSNFAEYGFDAAVAKPYRIETLGGILKRLCGR